MTLGEMKLRRDNGIERLAREIGKAAREIDRLLRHGHWSLEYDPGDDMPVRMWWHSPQEIRLAMSAEVTSRTREEV